MKLFFQNNLSLILMFGLFSSSAAVQGQVPDLFEVKINSLEGEPINLSDYKGKKILFVNVASKCGYTPQYGDLQKLHETHGDNLVIIGAPCNQFGSQEPGSAEEIQTFCERNYGVKFLITEKIDVKGEDQHPLYQWLTQKANNGVEDSKVKWNFNKYLIDEKGNYVAKFGSSTKPMSEKLIALIP
jgi:glutathione peroxidase